MPATPQIRVVGRAYPLDYPLVPSYRTPLANLSTVLGTTTYLYACGYLVLPLLPIIYPRRRGVYLPPTPLRRPSRIRVRIYRRYYRF